MPGAGIECPTCKRPRAPTLPVCPYCRVSEATGPIGEESRALLAPDERDRASVSALSSRLMLAAVPILLFVLSVEIMDTRETAPHAYATGGGLVALPGLLVALALTVALALGLDWLGRRVRIGGEALNPFALGVLALLGLFPVLWLPLDARFDETNAFGGDTTRVDVPCTWDEARQLRDARTRELLRVTVHARCTPPGERRFDVDIAVEAASVIDGARLVVPMWRGRWVGWLYARER